MKLFTLHLQVPDDTAHLVLRELTGSVGNLTICRRYIASVIQPGAVGMDQNDLMSVMDDINYRLSIGDSSEGYIRWGPSGFEEYMQWMEDGRQGPPPKPRHRFEVEAFYRTGTLYGGQGCMRVIGLGVIDP